MPETLESITAHIHAQQARGPFAYWPPEAEAAWKARQVAQPAPPRLCNAQGFPLHCPVYPNLYAVQSTPYDTWDAAIACGRSYLVGDAVPLSEFLRTHTSALTPAQKVAWSWARVNPAYKFTVSVRGKDWEIYQRGQYVVFALPHHDAGGERTYISRDGRTKVLINVD